MKVSIDNFKYSNKLFDVFDRDFVLLCVWDKEKQRLNPITIGWGFIGVLWGMRCGIVFVKDCRYTRKLLEDEVEWSVCFFQGTAYKDQIFLCGNSSGRSVNKMEKCNFTDQVIDGIHSIKEASVVANCKTIFKQYLPIDKEEITNADILRYYMKPEDGCHTMFIGKIVSMYRDETYKPVY